MVASEANFHGDVDAVMADCDIVLDRTFHTKAFNQAMMDCETDEVVLESTRVRRVNTQQVVSLTDIAYKTQVFNNIAAEATATHSSPVSPPPFMVGMVEIELDKLTGLVTVLDYMAVVDCGIPITP